MPECESENVLEIARTSHLQAKTCFAHLFVSVRSLTLVGTELHCRELTTTQTGQKAIVR